MADNSHGKARHWGETLLVALIGAVLFYLCRIPLPFVLGPMAAVAAWRIGSNRKLTWPNALRQTGLLFLGYMLGSSFSLATVGEFAHHLPLMLLATLLLISFSLLMGYWTSKAAGIDGTTAMFGSVPGGLTQMVVLAQEVKGVDTTVVTFMQTVRMMGVIFFVPFLAFHGFGGGADGVQVTAASPFAWNLSDVPAYAYVVYLAAAVAGGFLGQLIRLPSAFLLGPMFAVVILILTGLPTPHLPNLVVTIAQVMIASSIGLNMRPEALKNVKLAVNTVISSVLLVAFALLLGWILSLLSPIEVLTGFISTAPGGMAEMGVTAQQVHADVSMVTGYHLFRIFFIMFGMPPLLQWWIRRRNAVNAERR